MKPDTLPGWIGTAHVWTADQGAQVIAVEGYLINTLDLEDLDDGVQASCLETVELFRTKLKEAFSVIWDKPVGVAFDVELEETSGGHRRKAPSRDSRPQDKPGFDRLHHIAQLWVDYLTARNEPAKQSILFEAACNIQLVPHRFGDEGEAVLGLIENAIRAREVVWGPEKSPKEWAVAVEGGISIMREVLEL